MGLKPRPARRVPKPSPELLALLGHDVPGAYLRLITRFPAPLAAQLEARGPDLEQPLFRQLETVLEENRLARAEDIWTEDGPWPSDHLMIGAEIGGDKFSLFVSEAPGVVYRFMHESGTFEVVGSLQLFLRAVKRWLDGAAKTITAALAPPTRGKAAAPPWLVERRRQAALAPEQETKARRTNVATDWGDACLFYEWGSNFDDALRCCERWVELSSDDPYPKKKRAELRALAAKAKVATSAKRVANAR